MAKSFFERLTGGIRINEDAEEPAVSGLTRAKAYAAAKMKSRRDANPTETKIIHPVAADEDQIAAPSNEPEIPEEGQLTVDIYDEGAYIVIQSSMAGVKSEDIDISLQEDTLTIRGARQRHKEVNEDNFYYKELYWGSFSRSIILPEEVDFQKAEAALKNGLLTIRLPKKDRTEKKIKVKME